MFDSLVVRPVVRFPRLSLLQTLNRYLFHSDTYGYSIVRASCLDNHSHTHEFGHNLGCHHNRGDTSSSTDYAHAVQYCDAPM